MIRARAATYARLRGDVKHNVAPGRGARHGDRIGDIASMLRDAKGRQLRILSAREAVDPIATFA
jgi:hypothetical protein